MFTRQSVFCVAAFALLAIVSTWPLQADDSTVPGKLATPQAKIEDSLPGDVHQLMAFVKGIHGYQPRNAAERQERSRQAKAGKSYATVEAALEKIHRLATEDDKKLPAYRDARDLRLVFRTIIFSKGPRTGTPAEQLELIGEIEQAIAPPTPSRDAVEAALKVASALEYGGQAERAVEVYRKFGGLLSKSSDAETAATGAKMEGAGRRLELVGMPLDVRGTQIDGTKLDWAQYRGKVVLVDFWATWCGPCLREMPAVKKCYEAYHDRGFEVIGISLDEDRKALEKFLADDRPAWVTLHDGGPDDNPLVRQYGVLGVPTMLRVDQHGIVVSIAASGTELDRQLAVLLGPADRPADKAPANKE